MTGCVLSRLPVVTRRLLTTAGLPDGVRNAAKDRLTRDKTFHAVFMGVEPTTGSEASTTGHDELKCRIYSVGSAWPDKSMKYDNEDAPDLGPNVVKNPLPGILVQDSTGFVVKFPDGRVMDDHARELCFKGLRATYGLYKFFGRNPLDNKGKELVVSIHIGIGYANAYWSVDQMFFGDGGSGRGTTMPGAEIPNDLVNWYCCYDFDSIGHELTHGVVQESTGFDRNGGLQAATLNESISDCFGMMVKQRAEDSQWMKAIGISALAGGPIRHSRPMGGRRVTAVRLERRTLTIKRQSLNRSRWMNGRRPMTLIPIVASRIMETHGSLLVEFSMRRWLTQHSRSRKIRTSTVSPL